MAASLINPEGHVQIPLYHHVAVATGSRQVHIAGQVAWDENGDQVAPAILRDRSRRSIATLPKPSTQRAQHSTMSCASPGTQPDGRGRCLALSPPASNKQHGNSIYRLPHRR